MANTANNDGASQELIAQRAYELWESEGRPEGRAMDHWSRAEQMLRGSGAGDRVPQAEQAKGEQTKGRKPAANRNGGRKNLEMVS